MCIAVVTNVENTNTGVNIELKANIAHILIYSRSSCFGLRALECSTRVFVFLETEYIIPSIIGSLESIKKPVYYDTVS